MPLKSEPQSGGFFQPQPISLFLLSFFLFFKTENSFAQKVSPDYEVNKFNLTYETDDNLTDFQVIPLNGQVYLKWFSCNEGKEGVFIISRTNDRKDFRVIGVRKDAPSANPIKMMHSFIDKKPVSGPSYYRVIKVFKDGSYFYSDLEEVLIPSNDLPEKTL